MTTTTTTAAAAAAIEVVDDRSKSLDLNIRISKDRFLRTIIIIIIVIIIIIIIIYTLEFFTSALADGLSLDIV